MSAGLSVADVILLAALFPTMTYIVMSDREPGRMEWRLITDRGRIPVYAVLQIREISKPPSRFILIWSQNAAYDLAEKIWRLAPGPATAIVPTDDTPIPDYLAGLARLEPTFPADILWQWRVRVLGAPDDHVRRPKDDRLP